MSGDRLSSRRLLRGLDADDAAGDHPGWDLILYVFEYVVQLLGVYTSCPLVIASTSDTGAVDRSVFTLLLSTLLLAAEFATDAYDAKAFSAPKLSALRLAFWGLAFTALTNSVLFALLACTEVSGAAFFIAWVFCLVSSVIAPACLIKYQLDLFIACHDHSRDEFGS